MDECEELCNRLAIMTSGKFKCIGYTQKLKEIFGKGFTILIKLYENCPIGKNKEIEAEIIKMFLSKLRDNYAVSIIIKIHICT